MSVMYSIVGDITVYSFDELKNICAELDSLSEDTSCVSQSLSGDGVTLDIQFYGACSYSSVELIEGHLKKLGRHAVRSAKFEYVCDGEAGTLVVGPSEKENDKLRSSQALKGIQELASILIGKDKEEAANACLKTPSGVKP